MPATTSAARTAGRRPPVRSQIAAQAAAAARASVDHDRWTQFPTIDRTSAPTSATTALTTQENRAARSAHHAASAIARSSSAWAGRAGRGDRIGSTPALVMRMTTTVGTACAPSRSASQATSARQAAMDSTVTANRPHAPSPRHASASTTFHAGEFG